MPLGKFDMAIFTTGFYPDPYTDTFLCVSVPNKANPSGDNTYHYCDQTGKTDQLFAQLNASATRRPARQPWMRSSNTSTTRCCSSRCMPVPMYMVTATALFSRPPPALRIAWDAFDFDVK